MNGPLPETARRQFTLQQLFILITAIAIWLALIAWFGLFGFCLGGVMAITIVSYFHWARATEVIILLALAAILIIVFLPANLFVSSTGGTSRQSTCRHNLRMIALALSLYVDEHGSYPPIATYSKAGRPMHSWRTHILPQIERMDLALAYNWTEPWDGPVNSLLHKHRVDYFRCPGDLKIQPGMTSYLAIEVPGAKPGDPFVVMEVHGTSVHFFEPNDIALSDILAKSLPPGASAPRGVHGASARLVQFVWPTGEVEAIPISELPRRLAGLQAQKPVQPARSAGK